MPRSDPKNNTFTDADYALLSRIFRLIIQEIRTEEDKEKLAPGELGINYKEGAFYIRNPHNGKLFSPNSLEYIKQILEKFEPGTNIFNADRINGIRFYTRLSQLEWVGLDFTPDTVIRQMTSPSIFLGPILYEENFESLNWPAPVGMCMVYKGSEEDVMLKYYDGLTYTVYEGQYNRYDHMFVGWSTTNGNAGIYVSTVGGGLTPQIFTDKPIEDLNTLNVRVTETIDPGASLAANNGEYYPIVTSDGKPLATSIEGNNIIMLIYDEPEKRWVLLESSDAAVQYQLRILRDRVAALEDKLSNSVTDMSKEFNEKLDRIIDMINTRPGNIDARASVVIVDADNTTHIGPINDFQSGLDKLVVNYGQTLLREGIDYVVSNDGIDLLNNVTLKTGDVVQFIVLKQEKPNNF